MHPGIKYPIIGGNWEKHKLKCKAPHLWRGCGLALPPFNITEKKWLDTSGYRNHGTPTNGPTRVMTPYGRGLDFAFTADNHVVIEDSTLLTLADGDSATFLALLRIDAVPDSHQSYLFDKGRHSSDAKHNYGVRVINASGIADNWIPSFIYRNAPNTAWHRWNATNHLAVDQNFHLVAMTYTFGSGTSFKAYVDGVPVAGGWNLGNGNDAPATSATDLWIGHTKDTFEIDGQLTMVSLSRRIWAPSEIAIFAADPLAMWTPRPLQIGLYAAPPTGVTGQYYRRLLAA